MREATDYSAITSEDLKRRLTDLGEDVSHNETEETLRDRLESIEETTATLFTRFQQCMIPQSILLMKSTIKSGVRGSRILADRRLQGRCKRTDLIRLAFKTVDS
ncbi:hypothetical protein Bbelb_018940 [Branchiostoma belcheri]|nr:hypothetical protein Bbelb_018940 [Branchiostoma belcheri]